MTPSRTQLTSLGAGIGQNPNGSVAAFHPGTIVYSETQTPYPIYNDSTSGSLYSSDGTFVTDRFGRIPGWGVLGDVVDITIPPADTVTCILQGLTGAAGPPGPPSTTPGPQGPIGPPAANFRGPYAGGTTYANGDWVTDPVLLPYVSIQGGNVGHPLTDRAWWEPWLPTAITNVVIAQGPFDATSAATALAGYPSAHLFVTDAGGDVYDIWVKVTS